VVFHYDPFFVRVAATIIRKKRLISLKKAWIGCLKFIPYELVFVEVHSPILFESI
jgi:hypothetical protein